MLNVFGSVKNPLPATSYGSVNPGLPLFISNLIKVVFVVGGLFFFFNLFFAGFNYMSAAGDKAKLEKAFSSINMSLVGLLIMISAGILTGIVSFILFGSPTAILAPTITGPGTLPAN